MSDTDRDALAVLIGYAMGYARATEHTRHIAAYLIANRDAVLRALNVDPAAERKVARISEAARSLLETPGVDSVAGREYDDLTAALADEENDR